jgi:hypothetical protein
MARFLEDRLSPVGLAEVAEYTVMFAVALTTVVSILRLIGIV